MNHEQKSRHTIPVWAAGALFLYLGFLPSQPLCAQGWQTAATAKPISNSSSRKKDSSQRQVQNSNVSLQEAKRLSKTDNKYRWKSIPFGRTGPVKPVSTHAPSAKKENSVTDWQWSKYRPPSGSKRPLAKTGPVRTPAQTNSRGRKSFPGSNNSSRPITNKATIPHGVSQRRDTPMSNRSRYVAYEMISRNNRPIPKSAHRRVESLKQVQWEDSMQSKPEIRQEELKPNSLTRRELEPRLIPDVPNYISSTMNDHSHRQGKFHSRVENDEPLEKRFPWAVRSGNPQSFSGTENPFFVSSQQEQNEFPETPRPSQSVTNAPRKMPMPESANAIRSAGWEKSEESSVKKVNWQKSAPFVQPFRRNQIRPDLISQAETSSEPSPSAPSVAQPTEPVATEENQPTGGFLKSLFRVNSNERSAPKANSKVPPVPTRVKIPLNNPKTDGDIDIQKSDGLFNLSVVDKPLNIVLAILAELKGVNIITAEGVTTKVTVHLRNVAFEEALDALLAIGGYTWSRQKNIILVTSLSGSSNVSPTVQGRELRVFQLSFASAQDVDSVVQQLLSPVGKSFTSETQSDDQRQTRELIVVEDLPAYLKRVENYISQIDQPPRQVLIEAHIFKVDLTEDNKHGVNLEYLTELAGSSLSISTTGFANPLATPSLLLDLKGTELDALIEALKITTNAKTLASPRVLVLNGQQARIQIGSQFGYFVTSTTETSTLQSVEFLEVGVVLNVTPYITEDNHIIMSIKPEVSTGRINPTTGLPEEDTTEVETTVMLADNHGMIIGGLIEENDTEIVTKIPIVGDWWVVGRLFQRRTMLRERSEIIIALIPRIVPYTVDYDPQERSDYSQASTRLFHSDLKRMDRPWEPVPSDAERNPRRLKVRRLPNLFKMPFQHFPRPIEYFFPSVTERKPWLRGRVE